MTDNLTPSEVRAVRMARSGAPPEVVAVLCGLSIDRVKELHSQQRLHDRQPCQSARDAIRGKRALPKLAVVQYEKVEPYSGAWARWSATPEEEDLDEEFWVGLGALEWFVLAADAPLAICQAALSAVRARKETT